MHVDTGHNFPEVIEFRDRRVAELGERLDRRLRAGVHRHGPCRRADGPARLAQPAADHDAARRDDRTQLRRRHRRRAPRRGAGARQGADLLLPRRLRPVGPARAAARALESLQREDPQGRAGARLPDLELDRARRVAVRRSASGSSSPRSTTRTSATCSSATGCSTPQPTSSSAFARGAVQRVGALPHRRRHVRAPAPCAPMPTTLDDVVAEIAATRITERGETRADDRALGGGDGGSQACRIFLMPGSAGRR